MDNLRQLRSFAATFALLSADFLRDAPARNTGLALVSLLIGLVYPLPIIGLLLVTLSFAQGETEVARSLGGIDLALPNTVVLVASAGALATIYVLRVVNGRAILARSRAWQRSLFRRLVVRTTELGRRDVALPRLDVEAKGILGWASRLGQAGTQIALLFVYGLNSVSIILVLTLILAVVSWPVLGVLAASFVVMLPFYGTAMRGIRDTRSKTMADLDDTRAELRDYIDALRAPDADAGNVPAPDDTAFASLQMVGFQHRHLLLLQMYAGLHVGVVLVALVALSGRLQLSLEQGALAVILCYFLLRTVVGFVQFMGQLVRNYENVSRLRRWLHPLPADPEPGALRVRAAGGEHPVTDGRALVLDEPAPTSLAALQDIRSRIRGGSGDGAVGVRLWSPDRETDPEGLAEIELIDVAAWRELAQTTAEKGRWLVFGALPDSRSVVERVPGDGAEVPRAVPGSVFGSVLGAAATVRATRVPARLPTERFMVVGSGAPGAVTDLVARIRTVVLREMGRPQVLAFTIRRLADPGEADPDGAATARGELLFVRGRTNQPDPERIYHRLPVTLSPAPREHRVEIALQDLDPTPVTTLFLRVEGGGCAWEMGELRVEGPERTALYDRVEGEYLKHRFVPTERLLGRNN